MKSIFIGTDKETGKRIYLPKSAFSTHLHMPGLTGTGKTTLILRLLHQLLRDPFDCACHIIFDFMGGLSWELNMWAASPWCPQHVRDRWVYIALANKHVVPGINPLLYDDEDDTFYKVSRATELILRAWESSDLSAMPRLARWLFNSLFAAAKLGLTIGDTEHLLLPGSDYHAPMMRALPPRLQAEWHEILAAHSGSEATRILDSSRNRLSPFYNSGYLRRMFSSSLNRIDVRRLRRERKIVILDLSPQGKLSPQEQDAAGGMFLNECITDARSQPPGLNESTYLWLDEFQRMARGPDLEYAIPEVRQLNVKLVLAHQAYAQLKGPSFDLTPLIWVPRTRFVFGLAGEDADLAANEFAALTYDPRRIKDQIETIRQLKVGWEKIHLHAWGDNHTTAQQWNEQYGQTWAANRNRSRDERGNREVVSAGDSHADQRASGKGGSDAHGTSHNVHEQLIEKLETFRERSSTTYFTYDELYREWGRKVREQKTGETIMLAANDPQPHVTAVHESRPGFLSHPKDVILAKFPQQVEAMLRLIEWNNQQDFFVSPAVIERETQERLNSILRPKIVVRAQARPEPPPEATPFT